MSRDQIFYQFSFAFAREVLGVVLLGSALLGAGCQEHGVTKFNNDPAANIRSPTEASGSPPREPQTMMITTRLI